MLIYEDNCRAVLPSQLFQVPTSGSHFKKSLVVHVSPIIAYCLLCLRIGSEEISLEIIYPGSLEGPLPHNKTGFFLKKTRTLFEKTVHGMVFALCGGSPTLL